MPFDGSPENLITAALRAGRERLVAEGWRKGPVGAGPGICAIQALNMGLGINCDRPLHAVARRRGFNWIQNYNDAPETTFEDILSAYDEAIASSRLPVVR